jgi:hypothetical protein
MNTKLMHASHRLPGVAAIPARASRAAPASRGSPEDRHPGSPGSPFCRRIKKRQVS